MEKLDFLSPKTTFFYNGKTSYSSVLGGILTVFTAVMFCGLSIFFGWDLFARQSPEISFSRANNDTPEMSRERFFTSIAVMYAGGFPIQEIDRKLKFEFEIIETDVNAADGQVSKFFKYPMVPCDETSYFKENKGNLKGANIAPSSSYYCPPEEIDYTVHGVFGSSKFSVVKFHISYCSGREDCYSPSEIASSLSNIYFQATFKDYYVDAFDFNEPVKDNLSQILNFVSSGFLQVFHVNFQELYFNNEEGWFFSQNSETRSHVYDSYDYSIDKLEQNNTMIQMVVGFNRFKQQYNRKYIKVQNILAQVSGAIKLVTIGLKAITSLFSNYSLNLERIHKFDLIKSPQLKTNNFTPSTTAMSNNKLKQPNSTKLKPKIGFFSILRMRKESERFSKLFKNIFSEQNLFEVCILHALSKSQRENSASIEEKINKYVKLRYSNQRRS